GAEVTSVQTVAEARQAFKNVTFDFALLDVNLPDGRSLTLFEEKLIPASTIAVVMTGDGAVAGAVEAIQLGAADYLVKPFDLDELSVRFGRARRERGARRGEQHRNREQIATENSFFFGAAP